jgi:hypothetical protein
MTKIQMFEMIKSHLTSTEEIEFINHEIELLKSKNANRKPTTNQIENNTFKSAIAYFLTEKAEEKFTISEIQAQVSGVETLSNQRMSALMNQLVNEGVVKKVYEKRKAYFFV